MSDGSERLGRMEDELRDIAKSLSKLEGSLQHMATRADVAKLEGAQPHMGTKADIEAAKNAKWTSIGAAVFAVLAAVSSFLPK